MVEVAFSVMVGDFLHIGKRKSHIPGYDEKGDENGYQGDNKRIKEGLDNSCAVRNKTCNGIFYTENDGYGSVTVSDGRDNNKGTDFKVVIADIIGEFSLKGSFYMFVGNIVVSVVFAAVIFACITVTAVKDITLRIGNKVFGKSSFAHSAEYIMKGHFRSCSLSLTFLGILMDRMITVDLNDLAYKAEEEESTLALIKGVLAGIKERGGKVGGFKAYITSDVLIGAGLSSSAAFETIIGTIISGLYNDMTISAVDIAIIGQYAENVYFGKPCGLMDQMASSVGNLVHIDFADKKNPVIEAVGCDLVKHGYIAK